MLDYMHACIVASNTGICNSYDAHCVVTPDQGRGNEDQSASVRGKVCEGHVRVCVSWRVPFQSLVSPFFPDPQSVYTSVL